MTHARAVLSIVVATILCVCAAAAPLSFDFSRYDESAWVPVREGRFPSAGAFVQEEGCIATAIPEGTSAEDLLKAKGGVGFAMRLLKGVEARDGRAEVELMLFDNAAPSIAFRVQPGEGEVHGALYNLVILNQSNATRTYEGVNLWKWTPPSDGAPGKWQKIAYWFLPIPREERIKLGVDFRGDLMRVFVGDKEVGGVRDAAALGAGGIGFVAIEGPCRFYSFTFTPADAGK